MFAQHERVCRNAHGLGRHDLVTQRIADHPVLMYAGFVRKSVAADNRLVRLHGKADDLREHLTGRVNLAGIDSSFEGQPITPHVHRHYDFFQRSVAGAFANSIHRALDLARPGFDRREAVRHRQSEIVVTMDADGDVFSITNDAFAHRPHELREFIGESVSDGIRHVENRSAFGDRGRENFAEIINVAARGVFSRELNFAGEGARQAYCLPGHLDDLGARLSQFVFEMDIGGGDKSVDARMGRAAQSFGSPAHVLLSRPAQGGDGYLATFGGNSLDSGKVSV